MNAHFMLNYAIKFNHSIFLKAISDLSIKESLKTPSGKMNSSNWIAGHIIATRAEMLEKLGSKLELPGNFYETYKKGSQLLSDETQAFETNLMQELYLQSNEILSELVNKNEMEHETLEMLLGFMQHESYHIGQLGLYRRFLDKEVI